MASKNDIREELICSICYSQYVTPKSLPCAHTFCEMCLKSEIVAAVGRRFTLENGFHCPVCDRFTNPPHPVSPLSAWAANFPTDTTLKNIIDKMSNNCPDHSTQEFALFCFNCNKLLCTTCAWESHRQCDKVMCIEDSVVEAKTRMKPFIDELNQLVWKAGLQPSKLQQLDELKSRAEKNIRDSANAARDDVTRCENRLLEQLKSEHAERRQRLETLISSISRGKDYADNYVVMEDSINMLKTFDEFQNSCARAKTDLKSLSEFDVDQDIFIFLSDETYTLTSRNSSIIKQKGYR